MPLLITDFLVTGALAVAFILFLKTVVLIGTRLFQTYQLVQLQKARMAGMPQVGYQPRQEAPQPAGEQQAPAPTPSVRGMPVFTARAPTAEEIYAATGFHPAVDPERELVGVE